MLTNDFGNKINEIKDITSIGSTPSDSLILNALVVFILAVTMLASIYKLRGGGLMYGFGISALALASFMSVLAIPVGIYLVFKILGGSVEQ